MESALWRPMMPLVLLLAVVLTSTTANAAAVGISTFDSGAEGWTATTDTASPSSVSWASTGGNPGGYMHFEDFIKGETFLVAPASFHGDWSSFDGSGSLDFEHKIFDVGVSVTAFIPYRVVISGPGGNAEWVGTTPTGATDWVNLSAPINLANWTVNTGTWSGLLSNVTNLFIRMELVSGQQSPPHELAGIDNVSLVPEPASLVLLLGGLVGLSCRGRRRRSSAN